MDFLLISGSRLCKLLQRNFRLKKLIFDAMEIRLFFGLKFGKSYNLEALFQENGQKGFFFFGPEAGFFPFFNCLFSAGKFNVWIISYC